MTYRVEAVVSLESADLAVVVQAEGVVGGPVSKLWLPALMPSW